MSTPRLPQRPAALVTGAGRRIGIAAGIAERLADDGWDLPCPTGGHMTRRSRGPSTDDEPERLADDLRERGAVVVLLPSDLTDPAVPGRSRRSRDSHARAIARPGPVAR